MQRTLRSNQEVVMTRSTYLQRVEREESIEKSRHECKCKRKDGQRLKKSLSDEELSFFLSKLCFVLTMDILP